MVTGHIFVKNFVHSIVHGLEKVNWCEENKILGPDQKTTGRRHPFQLSREPSRGNEPISHLLFNRMVTPLNNLP